MAYLTDTANYAPPSSGSYGYSTLTLASGLPAVGSTYSDPVFGGVIKRLTNAGAARNNDDIYGHHWANADGTYCFSQVSGFDVIRTSDGSTYRDNVPTGTATYEINWHPTDPEKYFYLNGSSIGEYNLTTQATTNLGPTAGAFPSTLETMGGSLNWVDGTGDYFVATYGGTSKLWKRGDTAVYANPVTPLSAGGWTTISPDANYLITAAGAQQSAGNYYHKSCYSYSVNHGTKTVSATPVDFWGWAGDHMAICTGSDGKTYAICHDIDYWAALVRVDVTLDKATATRSGTFGDAGDQAMQDNAVLINLQFKSTGPGPDGHLSGGIIGANQDWVFYVNEYLGDAYDGSVPSPWQKYRNEIFAINYLTLEVRRYAHHRSRIPDSVGDNYYTQPRISSSWDGTTMVWTSNYNSSSPAGRADMFTMDAEFSDDSTPPAVPTGVTIT